MYKKADLDKEKEKNLSILAENGTGFFYGKLNKKKRKMFKKYSDKCQRIWKVDRDIEAKNVNKSPKIRKVWR